MVRKTLVTIVCLFAVVGAGISLSQTPAQAQDTAAEAQTPPVKTAVKTFTYKKVGDLEIKADVHQIDDNQVHPVVVWIHGGALITGNRQGVGKWFKEELTAAGCHVVSIDYRLAPETKLPYIIEDLEDAFKWVRTEGPKLFKADADRIAVMGGSAGGYLALSAGYRVKPRLQMIVSLWGYGDLVGPWQSEPSTHPSHNRAKMTKEMAMEITQLPPIANDKDREGNGWAFYQYCRQNGIWPELAGGWPLSEKEKFYPFMPLKNVDSDYPPTLLIHGTKDADVPHEQSEMMVKEFEKFNIPHTLFSGEGAGHGFRNADPKDLARAQALILEFVNKYLTN